MELKLRARLTAYSKVDSMPGAELPELAESDAGSILGVDSHGKYSLISSVKNDKMDALFEGDDTPVIVSKDTIDSLFPVTPSSAPVNKDKIDTLFDDEGSLTKVTYDAIDSLFD